MKLVYNLLIFLWGFISRLDIVSMESQWVWPFELIEKIGEGGMGVVYRARYVGNNRQVAVKLIPIDVTASPTVLARFERELQVLNELSHPNIVHCFGGRCESKQRFYAMEYVAGGTLADLLDQKKELPLETALDFAIQMCEGLQYAHQHGVTHRDVKPGNFLITKTSQIKLSDFGLASIASKGRLTKTGRTVGTILYMSPEQIRGEPITPQVDLYGLGCVIFEMLVGNPPYVGNNAGEILEQHLKAPIPHVVRFVSQCPLELDELVCELLAKEPGQRPASAADVASRLNGILLPSRRIASFEPNLFPSTSPKAVATTRAPVKRVVAGIPPRTVSTSKTYSTPIVWITGLVLACFGLWSWYGWMQAASHLQQAEQTWVDLLQRSEPDTQVLALQALGKFRYLHPSSIERLRDSSKSPNVNVRLGALHALKQHAAESRSLNAELIRIQKSDENSSVRIEAGEVVAVIQQFRYPISFSSMVLPCFVVVCLAGSIFGGWWYWEKIKCLFDWT
jgi:serine/threonine protein kinase